MLVLHAFIGEGLCPVVELYWCYGEGLCSVAALFGIMERVYALLVPHALSHCRSCCISIIIINLMLYCVDDAL